jgi:syntaxin-binding protein 1
MRLLLCYLATHPGRFDDSSRERWAQLAQLPPRDMDTICNVQYLGVELKKAKRSKFTFMSSRNKPKKTRIERSNADAQALENGRFQPMIADTVMALVNGTLQKGPEKEWNVVEGDTEFDSVADIGSSNAASMGAKSMRTTKKPTWHKRGATGVRGSGEGDPTVEQVGLRSRVLVLFVIGGCTWSEIQAAHELSSGVDIVLGSTHLIEGGDHFLQELRAISAADGTNADM